MLEYHNRKLASDIEAVGFYDVVNTKDDIHCLCSVDVDTDEVILFHDNPEFDNVKVYDPYDKKEYVIPQRRGTLQEGIEWWSKATNNGSKLIIHNAHTYDRPVIDKVWPDNNIPFDAYHDTFIQSKVQWFERPCPKGAKSPHGLKAYGIKCKVNKPEVTDWTTMDAFKLHRVVEDCKIQAFTYKYLQSEAKHLKDNYGIDFTSALKIESLYADECFKQEQTGAKVDVKWARECIEDLDQKIEELREEIEPELPPTIKGKGNKITRSEMAELFGFSSAKIKDKTFKKKQNGEVVDSVEKPYYKPSINFTRTLKSNVYSGFNVSYGESPKFNKKKQLTDWIKNNHPDTKPKDWGIEKTEEVTELLNKNTCDYFGLEPEDTDIVCGPFTRIEISKSTMTQNEVVKGLLIRLGWNEAEEWNLKKDVYDNNIKVDKKTVVRWPEKAHPDHQLVKVIEKGGYLVSSPKLTEEDYKQLPEGLGKKIAEYNTYNHRRRFLENPKDPEEKGILSYVRGDGRIPCGVNNFGTRSGRGSHRVWVNAPSESALYGQEIRKCIIPEDGKVLVGVDMKSAQLSIAAYYAKNADYYESVATGIEEDQDGSYVGMSAHCVNARMFGMVSEEEFEEAIKTQKKELVKSIGLRRKKSKGGSFAVIFGASGKKVAKTIGIPEKEGHQRKEKFLRQMGLDSTIKMLDKFEKSYPYKGGFYLPLAFGYWLWNNSPHKSVNTIVQGFEALAQKLAVIRVTKELEREGITRDQAKRIMETHDEMLMECTPEAADRVGEIVGEAYTWAADQIFKNHLKNPDWFANIGKPTFGIDLNGGYKIGKNYYEVH